MLTALRAETNIEVWGRTAVPPVDSPFIPSRRAQSFYMETLHRFGSLAGKCFHGPTEVDFFAPAHFRFQHWGKRTTFEYIAGAEWGSDRIEGKSLTYVAA